LKRGLKLEEGAKKSGESSQGLIWKNQVRKTTTSSPREKKIRGERDFGGGMKRWGKNEKPKINF